MNTSVLILGFFLVAGIIGFVGYSSYTESSRTEMNFSSENSESINTAPEQNTESETTVQPEPVKSTEIENKIIQSPEVVEQPKPKSSGIIPTPAPPVKKEVVVLENKPEPIPPVMEQKTFTLEAPNQSVVFDDLTITFVEIGHYILSDENGGDAGDSSYGSLALETPRTPRTEVSFGDNSHELEQFDSYIVTIDSVIFDYGVKLTVRRVAE